MSQSTTAGPAHRVQSAVVEYGYPQGHLGHLTTEEEEAFKNFKLLCHEKGYYNPGSEHEVGTHDDATLLRFLRARRFVVPDAFKQFEDTENWRKANELDKLYETIDLDHYEETRRLYPQWTGRRDRRGIPVYVFEVKHLNSKTMSAYEKSAKETHTKAQTDGKTSPKLLRLFALYENLVRFTMPLCTALKDRDNAATPITQSNNIVDISGVGLKQFWNLRNHMQDASTLATAHYPETLDRIFIIGAPAFFPTVWGWIKKWFDPITTSKIFILSSHDMKKTLEAFIDPVNIPKKYGGQLDFEFGSMPILDPALKDLVKWDGEYNDFPHGPMYWVDKSGQGDCGMGEGEMQAVAAGSVNKEERTIPVCTIKKLPVQRSTVVNGKPVEGNINAKELGSESTNSTLAAAGSAAAGTSTAAEEAKGAALQETAPIETLATVETKVVEEGKLVPASRPEPISFVTASEGINRLSLNEKPDNVIASEGSHSTNTANLLDPNVGNGVGTKEDATEHHSAAAENDPTTGGGSERADKAHASADIVNEKVPEQAEGIIQKVAQTVGF